MNNVISILGATCSSKSSFALDLANNLKMKNIESEIINVDAISVYKHLNIASAKPSKEDQKQIKHHLIDLIELDEDFSAGEFVKNSLEIIEILKKKNKIVLLVGGTGFYFLSLFDGIFEVPEINIDLRKELDKKEKEYGLKYLYNNLIELDYEFSKKISPNDIHRIKRALEVIYTSKNTYTSFLNKKKVNNINSYNIVLDFDRKILYDRIDNRVESMFKLGLVEEIESLKKDFNISLETKAIKKAIGYREFFLHKEKFIKEEIKKNTRRYAKRQLTFLKKIEKTNILNHISIDFDKNVLFNNILKYLNV